MCPVGSVLGEVHDASKTVLQGDVSYEEFSTLVGTWDTSSHREAHTADGSSLEVDKLLAHSGSMQSTRRICAQNLTPPTLQLLHGGSNMGLNIIVSNSK